MLIHTNKESADSNCWGAPITRTETRGHTMKDTFPDEKWIGLPIFNLNMSVDSNFRHGVNLANLQQPDIDRMCEYLSYNVLCRICTCS